MKKISALFILLFIFSISAEAQKLSTIRLSVKVTAVVEKDYEKEFIPVPDTIIVTLPKNDLSVDNMFVTPGHWVNRFEAVGRIPINYEIVESKNPVLKEFQGARFLDASPRYVPPDTNIYNLNFGKILCRERSGIIVLTPEGQSIPVCGVKNSKGKSEPAKLNIKGKKNTAYYLNLPKEIALNRVGGKESLTAKNFYPSTYQFKLDSLGKQTLNIGALLFTSENQTPGNYEGNFVVEVSFYKEPVVIYREGE